MFVRSLTLYFIQFIAIRTYPKQNRNSTQTEIQIQNNQQQYIQSTIQNYSNSFEVSITIYANFIYFVFFVFYSSIFYFSVFNLFVKLSRFFSLPGYISSSHP